ncbi:MAG: hypothetical protein AVDCRST_MAG95-1385 [uncultured Adhaeribacter sp.]|uniref:GSCFA domain-containing protein n=1 Tax=uncultured Adhaeribacter sp. TaxID=448109 RepID=A0A6J4I2R1_9BACT|nr:MAG: hypothetical protein AVDCRST_MAG95-1385 [uncultured Adhaeribacter sp.]
MSFSFRTELNIKPNARLLSLQTPVLTAGSCFAEVMGRKIQQYKVPSLVNPFGTIFNPLSLNHLLTASLQPQHEFTGELLQRDGLWLAYDFHSSFAAASRTELLTLIRNTFRQTQQFIIKADTLILTFGTAVGYIHRTSNQLVANCHKVPQQQFRKTLVSMADITASFSNFHQILKQLNPNIRLILTVSPVRHVKETLEGNSVSKSILRVACHELSERYPDVHYFPAYELLLDDLRDYRFYQEDMIHPNAVAEGYIWEKFKAAYCDEAFTRFTAEWDKIQQALTHRPFHPDAPGHQEFLRKTLSQLEKLRHLVDCEPEIALVKKQILIS